MSDGEQDPTSPTGEAPPEREDTQATDDTDPNTETESRIHALGKKTGKEKSTAKSKKDKDYDKQIREMNKSKLPVRKEAKKLKMPKPKEVGAARLDFINFEEDLGKHDLVLKCDGGDLYCNKVVLGTWSAWMAKTFKGEDNDIKTVVEGDEGRKIIEVTCEAKNLGHVKDLLEVIYPPNKDITDDNVDSLLELATDWSMKEISRRCEKHLSTKPITEELFLKAQKYNLKDLTKKCVQHFKKEAMTSWSFFDELKPEVQLLLLSDRVKFVEGKIGSTEKRFSELDEHCAELLGLWGSVKNTVTNNSYQPGRMSDRTRDKLLDDCEDALEILKDCMPKKKAGKKT